MNKEERVIRLIEELESVFTIRTFLDHDPYYLKGHVMRILIRPQITCLRNILIFMLWLTLQLMTLRN